MARRKKKRKTYYKVFLEIFDGAESFIDSEYRRENRRDAIELAKEESYPKGSDVNTYVKKYPGGKIIGFASGKRWYPI